MESAKIELEDLNARLAAYVHRVQQLKDENDMKALVVAIEVLEEDLRSLRASYECQVNHLSSSIRIVTEEKYELEKELLARRDSDAHFMDRISLESSKNAKLLLDISSLKTELSDRDHEVASLKLRIRQLQLEAGDGQSKKNRLLEEIQDLKQKLVLADESQANMSNQLSTLTQKLIAQEKMSKELSLLQSQLADERKKNRYLKMENYQMGQNTLTLQKQIVELNSKIQTQDHQNHLIEQALHSSQREIEETRKDYERKLQQLENVVAEHASASEAAQSQANMIRAEVARLRGVLETEERRLHLSAASNNEQTSKSHHTENKDSYLLEKKTSELELRLNDNVEQSSEKPLEPEYTKSIDFSAEDNSMPTTLRTQNPVSKQTFYSSNGTTQIETQLDDDDGEEDEKEDKDRELHMEHQSFPENSIKLTERGFGDMQSSQKDELLYKSPNSVQSPYPRDQVAITNSVGQITICEVDPDGRFLRIWNSSHQSEFDLGGHELQQKVDGEAVNRYRFGIGFRLAPRTLVTLWAKAGAGKNRFHYPPKDIQCKTVAYWLYGPSCTTLLCDPSGQVLAWLNAPYRALSCRVRPSRDYDGNSGLDIDSRYPPPYMNEVDSSVVSSTTKNCPDSKTGRPMSQTNRDQPPPQSTPDLLKAINRKMKQDNKITQPHDIDRNQPNCLCEIPNTYFHKKPKRPIAPHFLLNPEYPSTLGLRPDQHNKASISLRTLPIGLLNRPQVKTSLH